MSLSILLCVITVSFPPRDWLVGNATQSSVPTLDLSTPIPAFTNYTTNVTTPAVPGNLPTFSGTTSNNGYTYQTTATYITGLLSNSSDGVNHYLSVEQVRALTAQPRLRWKDPDRISTLERSARHRRAGRFVRCQDFYTAEVSVIISEPAWP